jgi:DNA damage-binding protein 1
MKVNSLSSIIIGSIPTPSSLVSLGKGVVYCGSRQGDSTLIQLKYDPYLKYKIQILQTFENIGPITDFCIFDYNDQGKVSTQALFFFNQDTMV